MTLRIEDCVNDRCPQSGEPVAADSLARYRGHTVGFCNPGCRDTFVRSVEAFERALTERGAAPEDDASPGRR